MQKLDGSQKKGNTKLLGALSVTVTSICYGLVPSFSFIAFGMGVETEFLFASDATLMGSAWAGLI